MNKVLMLAFVLLATGAGQTHAGCYGLWQAQCFEVHDARSRDITHHILITDGPVRLNTETDSCDAESALLADAERQALRAAFNDRIRDIEGCEPVDKLKRRVSEGAEPLVERFQRLKEPDERKKVHILVPPETSS